MQRNVELEATIVAKYAAVSPVLDERSRRGGRLPSLWPSAMAGMRWCRQPRVWPGRRSGRAAGKSRKAGRRQVAYDARARGGAVSNRGSLVCWLPWKGWWIR